MLAVRLGTFKSNDEALQDYPEGADLIGKDMMGSEIDKILIDREYNRIKTYYEGQANPDADKMASEWKSTALKNIMKE